MNYAAYSTEDFLADESFQAFVAGHDAAAGEFWRGWLAQHPAQQAAAVQARYAQVAQAHGGTARRTEDLTAAAQAAQKTVFDLLPALLGPLGRVAVRLGDADL